MIVCVLSLLMLKDIDLWTVNEDEFSSVNDDDYFKCWLDFVAKSHSIVNDNIIMHFQRIIHAMI